MSGKVFISCGQRPPDETRIAESIKRLLKEEFGLDPYLAFKIQSFEDIMTITKELRSSDYFVFIDFLRVPDGTQDLPCSLFTHQELALAHHLGLPMIALQQKDAPLEGFSKYVLCNPEIFYDENDLLIKIKELVEDIEWTKDFSRNLVIEDLGFHRPIYYADHTSEPYNFEKEAKYEKVYQIKVKNKRPDFAALDTICVLESYFLEDGTEVYTDQSYLKWAGHRDMYAYTILPESSGIIDLFAIRKEELGIFLHSIKDEKPREPIIKYAGDYELRFKLFAQGFQPAKIIAKIKYQVLSQEPQGQWLAKPEVELLSEIKEKTLDITDHYRLAKKHRERGAR